jgi:hypothetical protein
MSDKEINKDSEYVVDVITGNSIKNSGLIHLSFYILIIWVSGLIIVTFWYDYFRYLLLIDNLSVRIILILIIPLVVLVSYFIIFFNVLCIGKLLLIFFNLIHKPREGVFRAEKGNRDYEFWCLRTKIKKIALWVAHNSPLPWIDILVFKIYGVKAQYRNLLHNSWCDIEFLTLGKNVLVGQGAVVMSSMIIGQYLIIKEINIGDNTVIGGQATISPGTYIGSDTIIGALGLTSYNQKLEDGWVYFGFPVIKLKPNKYAQTRSNLITKVNVDESKKLLISQNKKIENEK